MQRKLLYKAYNTKDMPERIRFIKIVTSEVNCVKR